MNEICKNKLAVVDEIDLFFVNLYSRYQRISLLFFSHLFPRLLLSSESSVTPALSGGEILDVQERDDCWSL